MTSTTTASHPSSYSDYTKSGKQQYAGNGHISTNNHTNENITNPTQQQQNNNNDNSGNVHKSNSSSSSSKSSNSNSNSIDKPISSGVHSFMVYDSKFVIDSRYVPLKPLGRGAYGVVCSATDRLTGRKVAIKKIHRAFDDLIDAKRILREVKLLRHFHHENIIGLRDLCGPTDIHTSFDDIYIILDFMETDLHKIIYSKNELTDEHIQYFIYQILKALKFIHTAQVIHRDLKPSNLLLNGNCDLKICDFGLARGVVDIQQQSQQDYELTEYVVTRWYRAPEIMCSAAEYNSQIDIWSVGCIMGELLGRKPLFPGDDYIKQMNLIFDALGTPDNNDLQFITNDRALEYIRSLRKKLKKPWNTLFPTANPLALDLLDRMLSFNPYHRITVDEALNHPYLRNLHNPRYEPSCNDKFDFTFERCDLNKNTIQDLMWHEILHFRPELRKRGFRRSKEDNNVATPFSDESLTLQQYTEQNSTQYKQQQSATQPQQQY